MSGTARTSSLVCYVSLHVVFYLVIAAGPQVTGASASWETSYPRHQQQHKDKCELEGKDTPVIIVPKPWVHAAKKSTVTLHCQICQKKGNDGQDGPVSRGSKAKVWWRKDGELLPPGSTSRVRQLSHRRTHHLLRIKAFRESDFGIYECGVNTTNGVSVKGAPIEVSGVPYPARFELPTLWSESTFKLSWRVNSTLPIISYRLEFRKVPYGEWVTINVPSDTNTQREADVRSDPATHLLKGKKGVVTGAAHKEVIYIQSYTLKGLRKDTSYEARVRSRNFYGLSAQSEVISFHTFDIQDSQVKEENQNIMDDHAFSRPEKQFSGAVPLQRTEKKSDTHSIEHNHGYKKKFSDKEDSTQYSEGVSLDASSEPLSTENEHGLPELASSSANQIVLHPLVVGLVSASSLLLAASTE